MNRKTAENVLKMTIGTLALVLGNYFFKFPNNFAFGGVSGFAIVLSKVMPWTPSIINLVINMLFLILGFVALGKGFGAKTVYVSTLLSVGLALLEKFFPMTRPLTDEPILEFAFAIILTAVGSGVLFHCEASSGGTDILALMLQKFTGINIAYMLFATDTLISISAFFVFDIKTALYSCLGLIIKSIVIDNTINSINRCKYVHIVCDNPDSICSYIIEELNKSATVCEAKGAFSHESKYIIMCVLRGRQEIQLRRYVKEHQPTAFVLVSNTSEIFGKGFMSIG